MRNTRKIIVALMLVVTMLVSMAVVASAVKTTTDTPIYLVPSNNWKEGNARFAVYTWDGGDKWFNMTDPDGDGTYECVLPAGIENIIFCRMNPAATANNWNNKWNQTSDLKYNGNNNCYTVKEGTWDKGGGTWSTFGSTCSHANLGAAATCTTPQLCLDCGDPVVSELGHSYNTSHTCTRCSAQASFTVAGDGAHLGTEWDTGNKANDMTYADGVYTKVYEKVAAGTYKFKVARDHDWGTAYPGSDKSFTVAESGSTVIITLKGTTVSVTVEAPVQEPDHVHSWSDATCTAPQKCECGQEQGEALGHSFDADGKCTVCGVAPLYIVAGDVMQVDSVYQQGTNFLGSSWSETDEKNKLGYNAETGLFEKSYIGVVAGEYHVKVVFNKSWSTAYGDKNGVDNYYIAVTEANTVVTITFDPKTNVVGHTLKTHTHTWADATCTEPQKCECGETQGEALGHSYAEGKCTVCGAEDSEYAIYAVVGSQLLCGEAWNLEITANDLTKGEDGIWTKTYENAPVGLHEFKIIKNRSWGTGNEFPTSNCKLYVFAEGCKVVISFNPVTEAVSCIVTAADGSVVAQDQDYYLVVGGNNLCGDIINTESEGWGWELENLANVLTLNADGLYEKVYTNVAAGSYEIKVVKNSSWDVQFGNNGENYKFDVAEDNSTVTILFNLEAGAVSHVVKSSHVHSYEADVTAPTCTTAGFTTYTCACGDSYTGDEVAATGHVCVLDVCLVCYLPQPSIVLGDNTVVVPESGSAFGMIYIAEAGTYQITANPATTACIFYTNIYSEGADFSIAADGTLGASWYAFSVAPVELQPGYYYIGVYLAGEYTVNLSTYVAPEEPPVANDNVIDFSKLDPYAKGTYADGEEQKFNDIFTFFHGKDSRIDGSEKSFEDGFSGTQRFGFGGKFKTVDGAAGRALQINAPAAGTVTLWWVSGGAGRSVDLLNAAFETISSTGTETVEDGGIYITTFEISEAGVYYLTNIVNNNYWFKVEYKASETPVEPPHENTLAVGDTNKIVVDGSVLNAYGQPIAWVEFVADEKAHYEFVGTDGALAFIYAGDIDINNAPAASLCGYSGKADLEAGTYLICIGGGKTGEFNIAVSKSEIPETPVDPPVEPPVTPEYPALQVGENTVTIDGSVVNLTGNAIAWYEFTVETAGTYAIVSDDLNGYFYSKPDIGDFAACVCGFKGVADLEPGKYYICVGKEGKTGEFSVSIVTGEIEAPASNTVVLGENKYVLNAPLLAIGYEFVTFTAEKAGWYTISGADPITFFIWPDYPNVAVTDIPTTAPYAWNVKHDNSGFEESFTVYLEAGVYAVGFRYDFAEVGEYDYTITYSETDPNPVEPPVVEPELNFFQKLWASIVEFFNQLAAWFQNLFAGNKE